MNLEKIKNYFEKISYSNFIVFILLFTITLVLYFQTLTFDYTALDDYDLIVKKTHILNRIENLPLLFKKDLMISESGIYYRPIISLTFMIDSIIGNKNAFMFHLSNVIYHVFASFIFFILINHFVQKRTRSLLLTLIFTIHPSLSQAVAWIPGRNDIILFIFIGLTFICYKKFAEAKNDNIHLRFLYLILTGLSFLLSLLSKENGLVILFFIILFQILFENSKLRRIDKIFVSISFIIPIFIYLILRTYAQIQTPEIDKITLKASDYIKGFINYFGKIFLPFNLNVITLPDNINLIYGIISFVLFIALCFTGIKNYKIFLFGILWFLAFLVSGSVGIIGFTNFLDHRLYVPMFGIFLSFSQIKLIDRIQEKYFVISYIFIFILFTFLNIYHTRNFKNPLVFYESALKSLSNSFFIQRGIANVYHRSGKYDLAEKHYRISLELNPNSFETLMNVGTNFKLKGQIDSAEFYFLKALRLNPNHYSIYNSLGNLYLQKNHLVQAEYYLKKAIELKPDYFEAINNLGVLYARRGNNSLAFNQFLKSTQINPDFSEGYFNLALYYFNKNQIDSSKFYLEKAIKKGFPSNNILSQRLNNLK